MNSPARPVSPQRADLDPTAGRTGFAWLTLRARHRRSTSLLIVLVLVSTIAGVDYLAGFWVSLQLFYLIPIMLAASWLGWRTGCLVALLCVCCRLGGDIAAGILEHVQLAAVFWNRLAELCVSWVLVWAFHSLVTLQRDLENRVHQRTAALEQAVASRDTLQKQLFAISQRERSAIGRDLHDGLGQHLTATSMAGTLLARRLATAGHSTADDARAIVHLIQEAIAKTRQIARGLLLSAIEPANLIPELEELADSLRKEHGLPCSFTVQGTLHGVTLAASSHLYYIAQEAARNALRHARASELEIDLAIEPHQLVLTVIDDGIGLAPGRSTAGMGLRIMEHRSELIGAEFSLDTGPTGGTCVRCRLPLPVSAS